MYSILESELSFTPSKHHYWVKLFNFFFTYSDLEERKLQTFFLENLFHIFRTQSRKYMKSVIPNNLFERMLLFICMTQLLTNPYYIFT